MQKAIAFDMDGVLINNQPLHYQIDMAVLKACNHPATLEDVIIYTGQSNPDRWPKYKQTLELTQSVDELIDLQTQIMIDIFNQTPLTAIDGIPELLQWLNQENIPCAVASSSSHELIELVLTKCNIKEYFTHLVSGEDVKNGKPAPDIYLKAARIFNLPPANCIAIEDSPAGMQSAKDAGFLCIGYVNPTTHGQEFSHAHHVITHFNQCQAIIKEYKPC